jgi:hypothetical protein
MCERENIAVTGWIWRRISPWLLRYRMTLDPEYYTAYSSPRQWFSSSVIPQSLKIIHKFTRFLPPSPPDLCRSEKSAVMHSRRSLSCCTVTTGIQMALQSPSGKP